MPKQKDLKRLVRSRMQKTGESYTTARVHLTRTKKAPAKTAAEFETLAGIKDATILAKSGKAWAEWVRILDAIDGANLPHRDIASFVHDEHGVDGWWSQSVTVGYERIKGLREIGQRRSGAYEASKSKTLPVRAAVAFDAFVNARTRKKWLADVAFTVRKATPSKSVRITWPDGTDVTVWITPKGEKCSVAVQHTKLVSRAAQASYKVYWAEKLAALVELLGD
ncbi:MAG: hypothetical protein L0Z51_02940 [Candidatus Latescibacteria bacterium]|nr:hypothetical protein [Candidatus Latescibacterota bacterium]